MKSSTPMRLPRVVTRFYAIPICLLVLTACGSDTGSTGADTSGTPDPVTTTPLFDYPPVDLAKVESIQPMGGMIGNHVTPIDHQYYGAPDFAGSQSIVIDVYSPADGQVVSIGHMGSFGDDYRIVVEHSDELSSMYIHVDNLSAKLAVVTPSNGQTVYPDILVTAGEIIGSYSGSVDYNIVDTTVTLEGFVVPASYDSEPWKIHTTDPFDYFNDSIRSTLIAKSLRTAEPIGGKIDYDIDGRLVGNWFLENTNGYAGLYLNDYWLGHLAFAYDYIVPSHIIASFGDYAGQQEQFGVSSNLPDPADVSMATGLVKYDLVTYEYYNGAERWDRTSFVQGLTMDNYPSIYAVVLVQLVEDRRLKVEIFYGQTSADVSDFTGSALYYVR
jgi:hypothetical protein